MYRRNLRGVIDRGKTRTFLEAMQETKQYQIERGIRARTTVWGGMTGQMNAVVVAGDFNTLDDLERFTDLAARDSRFAELRKLVRSQMVYDASDVSIWRLAYHSDGLVTSESSTEPRRYLRMLTGEVQPGRHRDFVHAVSEALEYQKQRGIDATTSVWAAITGHTNSVSIVAEFDTLRELEAFEEMSANDADFSRHRRATRETMVFLTSQVAIMRNLL